MAGVLGLMLAIEPIEPGIVQRLQRNPDTLILTRELIKRIFLVGMLLLIGSCGFF